MFSNGTILVAKVNLSAETLINKKFQFWESNLLAIAHNKNNCSSASVPLLTFTGTVFSETIAK
ncbi:MAG: hypothetical protein AAFY63_01565 [Cyanobacteria bacterium J06643_13]